MKGVMIGSVLAVGLLAVTTVIAAQSPPQESVEERTAVEVRKGETMLAPRSRSAYEKHLAELNARYGADKAQQDLKEAVLSANAAPLPREPGVPADRVVLPADIAPGQRLRVELKPHGDSQFLFQDEVYDSASLESALADVKRTYIVDQIVLLADGDRTIQVDHLLALARIGRDLEVTTAYQQGGELKLISAK